MSNETCILTNIDFTVLEFMRGRCRGTDDPLASIIKRKIESAIVVFHSDVPCDVATLNSRVTFSVNGGDRDTRVLSSNGMESPVGMSLPITTQRGLALLGLTIGHGFTIMNMNGVEERIRLEKILYQPSTSRRQKDAVKEVTTLPQRKPAFKLIRGSL